tara:strand:+ start:645 stop:863 length:219 start_codon:yes stop_codon:yes gene_type:complete
MTNKECVVNEYIDERGRSPYADWIDSLRDRRTQAKVILQVDKLELGLFGDIEPIGKIISGGTKNESHCSIYP